MEVFILRVRPLLLQLSIILCCSTAAAEPQQRRFLLLPEEKPQTFDDFLQESFPPTLVTDTGGSSMWGKFDQERMKQSFEEVSERRETRPAEFDDERADKAGNRALRMQLGDSAQDLLRTSELRPLYKSMMQYLTTVRNSLRVQVAETKEGLDVSQKPKGKPLLQLALEPSVAHIVEPVLTLGSAARFRYHQRSEAVLFEIQKGW